MRMSSVKCEGREDRESAGRVNMVDGFRWVSIMLEAQVT